MKVLSFLFLFCFPVLSLFSQIDKDYFQQELSYTIHVSLDDQNHILRGAIDIDYKNNSQDSLMQLYFHLWPNAFKNKTTAFAKQQLQFKKRDFHFAKEEELGYMDSLNFAVNGVEVNWKLDSEYEDIALLYLKEALAPGQEIQITTPFKVILPSCFSRLCRTEQAYQICHWYPKPAVYDKDGWHPMPYLSMGEFYSEFGDFDVQINLPAEYQLTATGIQQGDPEISQTSGRRLVRFSAKDVHDFAWIAGKDFTIETKDIKLQSGRSIQAEVWYTDTQTKLWDKAMDYTEDALKFYSKHVGEYPYEKVTVVQHPLKVGGGQEFPMITFIDEVNDARELDHVIAHEVGHNWFYGILANNERAYAWMDEGIDVYYDTRYTFEKYGDDHLSTYLPRFAKDKELSMIHYGYMTQVKRKSDQAPNTPSDEIAPINYPVTAYIKPSLALLYLEKYVGTAVFDRAMKKYYETWKFKHPGPEDLQKILETELNMSLNWLFEDMMNSTSRFDYAISKVKRKNSQTIFTIKNKGEFAAPVKWSAFNKNEVKESGWLEGFEGSKEVILDGEDYDWISLDTETFSLDADRTNNHIRPKALFKKSRSTKYGFMGGFDDSRFDKRYLIPLIGFNKYDGLMLGLADYEPLFPGKPVEQEFVPFFGLSSKNLVGIYNLRSNHYFNKSIIHSLQLGLNAKSFSYDKESEGNEEFRYWSIKPFISFEFAKDPVSNTRQSVKYQFIINGTDDQKVATDLSHRFHIHQLSYQLGKKDALLPIHASLMLEQQSYKVFETDETSENYLKLNGEFDFSYFWSPKQKLDIRFFASTYLKNSKRESNNFSSPFVRGSTPMAYQGYNDYTFDEFFIGRSEQEGLWAQQVSIREGGFKTALGSAFSSSGQSNSFVGAVNVVSDFPVKLPGRLPIKLFFDLGVFSSKSNVSDPLENTLWYSGGFMLDFFDGFFSIYFPLLNSSEINDLYNSIDANFGRKISFSLNLQKLHPERLKEEMLF